MKMFKDKLPLQSHINLGKEASGPRLAGMLFEANDDGYGNEILIPVKSNSVVFGGAVLALEHLTNTTATFKPATLNEIYDLHSDIPGSNSQSFISLFGVGTGGAALDFGNIKDPNVKQRNIEDMIPLRSTENLTGSDADKYFFKKPDGSGVLTNYYLKEFEAPIVTKSLWKDSPEQDGDGTEITGEIWNSQRTEGIESFSEFRIKFNTEDVREYFESIGQLNMARYNSIGLYTGQKVSVGGGEYDYVNVRLFSVVSFDNVSVKDKRESQYVYRVYSLV